MITDADKKQYVKSQKYTMRSEYSCLDHLQFQKEKAVT
jgi:hypothetical protein